MAFILNFPVLCNCLPGVHINPFVVLIGSVYILLSEPVSIEQVNLSEKLLFKFVEGVRDLYGDRFCSFNVHQLTHFGDTVRNWGALLCTSSFLFENKNGQLLSLASGIQATEKQLASLVGISNALNVLLNCVKHLSYAEFVLKKLQSVHFTRVPSSNANACHGRPH